MTRKLRWTPESERTFNQNIEYLAEEWDNQVIHNFLDRIEDVLEQIRINPELYSLHRSDDKIYKCIVHKRIII